MHSTDACASEGVVRGHLCQHLMLRRSRVSHVEHIGNAHLQGGNRRSGAGGGSMCCMILAHVKTRAGVGWRTVGDMHDGGCPPPPRRHLPPQRSHALSCSNHLYRTLCDWHRPERAQAKQVGTSFKYVSRDGWQRNLNMLMDVERRKPIRTHSWLQRSTRSKRTAKEWSASDRGRQN